MVTNTAWCSWSNECRISGILLSRLDHFNPPGVTPQKGELWTNHMCGQLIAMALRLDLPRPESRVLVVLCEAADCVKGNPFRGENCFPGIKRISGLSGYEERHTKRLLRRVEVKKLAIPIIQPGHKTGYEINLENGHWKSQFDRQCRSLLRGVLQDTGGGDLADTGQTPKTDVSEDTCVPAPRSDNTDQKGCHPVPRIIRPLNDPSRSIQRVVDYGKDNNSAEREYIERVLKTFAQIPGASPTANDAQIVARWFAKKVPVEVAEAALWIGATRHLGGGTYKRTLNIAFFENVVDEHFPEPPIPLPALLRYVEFIKLRMPSYLQMREQWGQA